MLNKIIDLSLRYRFMVLLTVFAMVFVGIGSLINLDIDAFPDTSPVMVQINTVVSALGPESVEQQVTFPIEQVMSGIPHLEMMRSVSKFGLSQVVLTFEEGTDLYFARTVVNEKLGVVELPPTVEKPRLGPPSNGLGEVLHYVVMGKGNDITELRTVQDWVIRPQLRTLSGLAEVNSWGGYQKQYQIRIDPRSLIKYDLTYDKVISAVTNNNLIVGGATVTRSTEMVLVQGIGRVTDVKEIEQMVVSSRNGVPILVGDIGEVVIGHQIRRGAVTADGKGEVVLGLGFLLAGENTHKVTTAMKARMKELEESLPPGVKLVSVYDRTELIDFVIETVQANLFEGGLLVITVLFLFLGRLRAAIIVAMAIPLSMLFAFSGMYRFGIAASLLSLGAIDFGLIVDSSVVMIENCVRRLGHTNSPATVSPATEGHENSGENTSTRTQANSYNDNEFADLPEHLSIIRDAAIEVRKPTLFGELIIMIVYLPILTLGGEMGKLFRPMALTVIFALLGSMILSMTFMPVMASFWLPKKIEEKEPFLIRLIQYFYRPILRFSLNHKLAVLGFAFILLLITFGMIAPNLGKELIPGLSEGAIAMNIVRLPGTDLNQSIQLNTQLEKTLLKAFPNEIRHIWCRIGTADIATDPMGVEMTDVYISLYPRSHWKVCSSQIELTKKMEEELKDLLGNNKSFSQPIKLRIDEITTGAKAPVVIKVFGDDLDKIVKIAEKVQKLVQQIPGNADVAVEPILGQPMLEIRVKQKELARYGISARVVLDLIESIGGVKTGEVWQKQYRFPLVVRLADQIAQDISALKGILLLSSTGEQIPLERLVDFVELEGPATINRQWGHRCLNVTTRVQDRDLGSFVEEVRKRVRSDIAIPPGGRYRIEFEGEYEQLMSTTNRLMIVVPVALVSIFLLLYFTYHSVMDALRVFTGVPFAWVGGILALWLCDMPFSISAAVGFIALSGVAVLDDMIIVSYIRQLRAKGTPLQQAVEEAALTRLRPVLMTTLVASLGFVPMAISTGMGAEVQRPLATVVIGGVISSMFMSLIVLRVLYIVFRLPSWILKK